MTNLYTGHEAEMEYQAEQEAAWAAKPLAERQIDVMRSRVESALDSLNQAGRENLFGEMVTPKQAVADALRQLGIAIQNAENQK